MLIKYKLIDQDGCTRSGESNSTYWLDGQWKEAVGQGTTLCTSDVIHWYSNPKLAVIFNPIHANIANPRMIEIEIEGIVAHNGLQGGSKKARFVREIPVPEISIAQKVEFAIRISLTYYREKTYMTWAENWLSGKDRSAEAAKTAMWDAKTAWRIAEDSAMIAEDSARAAAWAATWAAEASVRPAARIFLWAAARSAAWAAARIAEDSVRYIAWASEAAASASADDGLFIKIIEEVTENYKQIKELNQLIGKTITRTEIVQGVYGDFNMIIFFDKEYAVFEGDYFITISGCPLSLTEKIELGI